MFSKISLNVLRRYLITILVVLVALFIGWRLWIHYENDPWTRDGRIKADVVQVAPDVTGQVVKINVKDNQQVNVGDVLFEIDPARFDLALRQAKAAEEAAKVTLAQAIRESNRNRELKDLVAAEVTEQGQSRVEEARAALLQAVVNRDKASLTLTGRKCLPPLTVPSPISTCVQAPTSPPASPSWRSLTDTPTMQKAISRKPSCRTSKKATVPRSSS